MKLKKLSLYLFIGLAMILAQCASGEESGDQATSGEDSTATTREVSGQGCVAGDCQGGEGTFVYQSGSRYTGQFSNGQRNGTGTYEWASGSKYVGEWKDGERHWKGTYTWPNADTYVGEFVNDQRQGKGVYQWSNGERYEGDFVNGAPNE